MDCERFDKIALNLLYEELDELTAASARRHLHHCTRCKGIHAGLQATKELANVHLLDPPEGLRERILQAERLAHKELSLRERFGRAVSVMAGYAMRPQLAMAALLLLMVSTSLVFLRARPGGHDQVSVTERGVPGLDADTVPRHSIVTEPLPADAPAPTERLARAEAPAAAAGSSEGEPKGRSARMKSSAPGADLAAEPSAEGAHGGADFDAALAAYHAGRYAEAEGLFQKVAEAGGPQASRAALHEAHAARNGTGCQRAAGLYDTVATRYPGTPTADEASWHAASCYRALGQRERAAAHYRSLATRPGYADRAHQALSALEADAGELASESTAVAARKAAAKSATSVGAAAAAPPPASGSAAEAAAAPRESSKGDTRSAQPSP